jgi:RND family efflux transporter MFP subunit
VAALLPLLLLIACDDPATPQAAEAAPPPVTVAKPVVKQIIEEDEFTGRFEAVASVDVRARVDGYLDSVAFTDGAMVKKGDLLFVIDQRPFRNAIDQAEARLAEAQTQLQFTRVDLERVEQLARSGNAPARQVDERRQQFEAAQAEVTGAQAAFDQAKLELEYTEIRAPISGRISRKLVTEGNLISANESLLTTIVALDPIYFYFDVDERSYLAYVRMGRDGTRPSARENAFEVAVALADEDEPQHKGRMNFVDNRVDEDTGTMRGRAIFDNEDYFLTPGLFGRIVIPGSGFYQAVLVPDEAIGADLGRRFVYVVAEDGSISQQVIRPGPRHDGYRIVRGGLTGDETIIINGVQRVRFADRITPEEMTLPPSRATGDTGS